MLRRLLAQFGQYLGRRWGVVPALLFAVLALSVVGVLLTGLPSGDVPADALRCEGTRLPLSHVANGASPYLTLTADGHTGAFLVDYGATASTLSRRLVAPKGNMARLDVERFSLPTFPSGRFGLADYHGQLADRQLGVLGTDFLALLTADFSFGRGGGDVVLGASSCDPARLRQRGLVPIRQTGFFTSEPGRLAAGRPNVPVVFLAIGPVRTFAQIDSGYDDRVLSPSIDINEPLYRELVAAGVKLEPVEGVATSTCAGIENRSVYTVARIGIRTDDGTPVRDITPVYLVKKAANGCGGIAGMEEPAAQIAASLLTRFEQVVFDPRAETVWIGTR